MKEDRFDEMRSIAANIRSLCGIYFQPWGIDLRSRKTCSGVV